MVSLTNTISKGIYISREIAVDRGCMVKWTEVFLSPGTKLQLDKRNK